MSIIDCSSILEKMISFGGIFGKERLLNLPCLNGSAALHFLGCNLVMSNHYNKAWFPFLPDLPTPLPWAVLRAWPRSISRFWPLLHSHLLLCGLSQCFLYYASKIPNSPFSIDLQGLPSHRRVIPKASQVVSTHPPLAFQHRKAQGWWASMAAWSAISRGSLAALVSLITNLTVTLHYRSLLSLGPMVQNLHKWWSINIYWMSNYV